MSTQCALDVAAEAAAGARVCGVFRHEAPDAWRSALEALPYIPVSYSPAYLDYQMAYQAGQGTQWQDVSLVLRHDGRPCGVWPLAMCVAGSEVRISSHGLPILPPLFVSHVPRRTQKAVTRACLRLLETLCITCDVPTYESGESFGDGAPDGLSYWHLQTIDAGACASIQHELFVDLSLSLPEIRSRMRKSYRALVNAGARLWQVGVQTDGNGERWEEFHELHRTAAGRDTRSDASWATQRQALVDGAAMLVYITDARGAMVGGGYFALTRDEGSYSVAAYDRSLFERPLGHVVQSRAIEVMKARGLRWYKIGSRPYRTERPAPTAKEIAIGDFKQGFATHVFARYRLRRRIAAAEAEHA